MRLDDIQPGVKNAVFRKTRVKLGSQRQCQCRLICVQAQAYRPLSLVALQLAARDQQVQRIARHNALAGVVGQVGQQ